MKLEAKIKPSIKLVCFCRFLLSKGHFSWDYVDFRQSFCLNTEASVIVKSRRKENKGTKNSQQQLIRRKTIKLFYRTDFLKIPE